MRTNGRAPLQLAIKTADPSFLAVPPTGDALYAVNEPGLSRRRRKEGKVTAFHRDGATGGSGAEHRAFRRKRSVLHRGGSRQ